MKLPFSFSNSKCWKNMVNNTYKLDNSQLILGDKTINLFGNGSLYCNSPYITDGGFLDENLLVEPKQLEKISHPILLKTRSQIKISSKVPYVLDTDNFTFLLDLSQGKDFVWEKLIKSKTRNQVRKAEKSNYTLKIGKLEILDDFYMVLSKAWRDLGTPTHSKNFYKNIITCLSNCEDYQARFIVLYIDGKPASCACLIFDEYSLHHPYAATLKEYNHLSLNNALYWNIIQFGIEQNLHFFDMGRSKQTQSTAIFKKSWGANPVQLYYYYLNKKTHTNDEDSKFVKTMIEFWKKLPLKIANFLGPKIIYKVLK